jgi:hypothetical protein
VEDHHVDRPDVEVRQRMELTGPNRSIELDTNMHGHSYRHSLTSIRVTLRILTHQTRRMPASASPSVLRQPGGHGEGPNTRSHPELGREIPQRQWYCVLRRGRVGRCQAFQGQTTHTATPPHNQPPHAGWSSPVARQAHNLKVTGSNPVPATKHRKGLARPPAEPFFDVQSTKPNSRCIPPRPETRHLVHALPPNRPGRGIIGHHRRAQATHLALPAKRPRSGPSCSKNTRRRLRRNCMVRRYVKKHRLLLFWLVVDNCRMRLRTSWPDRERPGDGSIWKVLHPLHGGNG